MSHRWNKKALLAAVLAAASAAAGCAQDVGDIDRTEPNKIRKTDLTEGSWFMHQKVTHAPATGSSVAGFEGLMMDTDKIRFVAEENYLLAYRTYSLLPGSEGDTSLNIDDYQSLFDADYKGAVRAVFPISSHFDVQREYDASTGEQSNVITENTSDRNWYERDFIRVDWDKNPMINFENYLFYGMNPRYELGYQEVAENDPLKAPYFEYNNDGELVYFDAPATYIVQPDLWDVYYGLMGYKFTDYLAATEVRVVTSFAKDLGIEGDDLNNYEALDYPNQDMTRFGFFRTERMTYDTQAGDVMTKGEVQLANRHNIWKSAYAVNRDGNGKITKTLIPVEQREVRTIPYYIHNQVSDDTMRLMSRQVIDEWNVAFKRAVYLMQHPDNTVVDITTTSVDRPYLEADRNNSKIDSKITCPTGSVDLVSTYDYETLKCALASQTDIYVPCESPVAAGDNAACGAAGYIPREGDFRKNFLWLVPQRQDNGLLGYCPSATDPLTGRTISAQAHVYTEPFNSIARNVVDHVLYYRGEYSANDIRSNDLAYMRARDVRDKLTEFAKIPDEVRRASIDSKKGKELRMQKDAQRQFKRSNLQKFNYVGADTKLSKLIDTGLLSTNMDDSLMQTAMLRSGASSLDSMSDSARQAGSLFNNLSFQKRASRDALKKAMGAKGYCFREGDDASLGYDWAGVAAQFEGMTADEIYDYVRGMVFRSTALHEMGHGFGLRHNFVASTDAMNFFNKQWSSVKKDRTKGFWDLRGDDNFKKEKLSTIGEIYNLYNYSKEQLDNRMYDQQYSSIMDYQGYSFDNFGLGRYDNAAIVYGYSGTHNVLSSVAKADCAPAGGVWDDSQSACVTVKKGLVEVFADSNKQAIGGEQLKNAIGALPYNVLTHSDTTGVSTFDDPTTIGQSYLELIHYHDFFQPMLQKGYNFDQNRVLMRLDDYLGAKNKEKYVRVPYLFCSDDNAGELRSCRRFDHGVDYMEQVKNIINGYNDNYWFRDFNRGRKYWDEWSALGAYFSQFLTLSDIFQGWYVSDRSFLNDVVDDNGVTLKDRDDLVGDTVDYNAASATFNFFANVLATPEYGKYCMRPDNGNLFPLSAEDEAREQTSVFYRRAYCGDETKVDYYYIPQGEGRRRFNKYDVNYGYDYQYNQAEVAHTYTTIMAAQALFDNEASVIADTGDIGTYTFGMYDMFRDETIKLVNGLYAEDYKMVSPRLVANGTIDDNGIQTPTGNLVYPPIATVYGTDENGNDIEYDPLTGQSVAAFNALTASGAAFSECSDDSDCISDPNGKAEMICARLSDTGADRCLPLFYNKTDYTCPSPTELIGLNGGSYTCASLTPSDEIDENAYITASKIACSASNKQGACADGQRCDSTGACVDVSPIVETNTALSQKIYFSLFGMFLTGPIGNDSTLYDQFHIYKKGSGETAVPAKYYSAVEFSNPLTGEVYSANKIDCSGLADDEDPAICYALNQNTTTFGGAMTVEYAQKQADELERAWAEFLPLIRNGAPAAGTPAHNDYLNKLYKWRIAQYNLEYAVRDVNFIRSIYSVFGTLW